MARCLCTVFVLVLAFIPPAWSTPAAQYEVFSLGDVEVVAIDPTDDAVAVATRLESGQERAVVVSRTHPPRLLDLLPGGTFAIAYASRGDAVVGVSSTGPAGLQSHAFRVAHGTITDLGTTGGPDRFSAARCLTGDGTPVGLGDIEGGILVPLRFPLGQPVDVLATLAGTGQILTCNAQGDLAGVSQLASGPTHATLWPHDTLQPQDIQTLDGITSTATGMNATPEVVGNIVIAGTGSRCFSWQMATGMVLLAPTPGDEQSGCQAVNDAGDRVGTSWVPDPVAARVLHRVATIWGPDGSAIDLNTRTTGSDGCTWLFAVDIAPGGVIAAVGDCAGQRRSAFLVPVTPGPKPHERPKGGERRGRR